MSNTPTQHPAGAPKSDGGRSDPLVGQLLGDEFLIERQLGAGGMGTVYLAKQSITDRPVAIKTLHRHLIDETLVERFKQEAQIVSKLNHPNIVTVYKYGEQDDGGLYIAMEYAEGKSLTELILSGALKDLKRALPLMIQMADALAYAHDQMIVHRDIKPGNIMVGKIGRREVVKVLDFGIAKILDDNHIVTKTGMLCGSPEYMSPEQWHQVRDIDGRSDIYSLGCVFYAMVTGLPPFEADSVPGYMMKHVGELAPAADRRRPALTEHTELTALLGRCMSKERNDRFADAYELADALRAAEARVRGAAAPAATPTAAPAATPTDPSFSVDGNDAADIGGSPTAISALNVVTEAVDGGALSFLDDVRFDGDEDLGDDRPEPLGKKRREQSRTLHDAA